MLMLQTEFFDVWYKVVLCCYCIETVAHRDPFLCKHVQGDTASRKGGEGGDTSIYGPYRFIT